MHIGSFTTLITMCTHMATGKAFFSLLVVAFFFFAAGVAEAMLVEDTAPRDHETCMQRSSRKYWGRGDTGCSDKEEIKRHAWQQ
jgi:hypothetical protein